MSIFDRFFQQEQKPIAAIGGDEPAQPVEVVGAHATSKLKLNFKRLPKKVLQAIADQTTGQTIDRREEEGSTRKRPGSLTDIFNAAARGITGRGDDNDLGSAPAAAAAAPRMRDAPPHMPRPRPKAPSPSFGY
jgi:hypothetical protein